jgi:hypothetical protein
MKRDAKLKAWKEYTGKIADTRKYRGARYVRLTLSCSGIETDWIPADEVVDVVRIVKRPETARTYDTFTWSRAHGEYRWAHAFETLRDAVDYATGYEAGSAEIAREDHEARKA